MVELIRSNDLVLLSYVQALLRSENIEFVDLDQHMSNMDGNISAIPRRIMVDAKFAPKARQLLHGAGLGDQLTA